MSRVIKFKGLAATGAWAYGLPASDAANSTAYYSEYSQRICWLPESGGYANVPIKNGTLCQFTGLLDRNGKEIYEGDALGSEGGGIFEVKFEFSGWHFVSTKTSKFISYPSPYSNAGRIAVIGNRFDNPELLEVMS